ncbi:MAG: SCO family protein [Gammaproteobacteria bacterium]|nr:SCO family protein [Gammaproteobacteria bacterium]
MRALMVLCMLAPLFPSLSHAGLPPAQLETVAVQVPEDASLPLSMRFEGTDGRTRTLANILGKRPALLILTDYTCSNLCGPTVTMAVAGLAATGLVPGRDFRLLMVGLDPRDGPEAASAMRASHLDPDSEMARASHFLMASAESIEQVTHRLGYRFVYDRARDQFAHPGVAFVIDRNGRLVRVLSALALDAGDLRLAMVDAGRGAVGTAFDQIRLRCFGFDPARGIYTASIALILTYSGALTVGALAAAIAGMLLVSRRQRAPR